MSGVNVFTFWITSFLWDFWTYIITAILITITLAVFQEDGWSASTELMRLFIVLISFGFAALPLTFIASMFFAIPSSGFTRMSIINVFTGNLARIESVHGISLISLSPFARYGNILCDQRYVDSTVQPRQYGQSVEMDIFGVSTLRDQLLFE